jgi:DNA modification methylase
MQKPSALCSFLVEKHSPKGGHVVDAFGCSGSFAKAARALGRHWLYTESNGTNFELALRNMAATT